MVMKVSTGLRTQLLDTGSLFDILAGGVLKLYSGAAPATADAAVTGTSLLVVSVNSTGTGINFADTAVAGVLQKAAAEVWSGVVLATGTAGYFRHVAVGDTGALSTTEPRIQGLVDLAGAELNLTSVALVLGATQAIDFYSVAIPTL